ncbi:phytanoyl-CoA dioxygenase family protein [Paenibacillus sp. GCM10023252]|uniref:phytanoyl-CoA dioxygenase family protein n=1 Tax=Paenibacillus sp. GCM10023252 TaxID=3252649 RepID=UPI00360F4FE6
MTIRAYKDSTPLLGNPAALQERASKDGYLYFKQFFPRDKIMEVRQAILTILDERGLLDRNVPLLEGVANQAAVDQLSEEDANWNGVGVPLDVYRQVQQLEVFHALAHEPKLLQLYEMIYGEQAIPHPRNIGRLMLPHKHTHTTPPHQDFLHIQGSYETWTCWVPLGDVPRTLGGLSILEGSYEAGLLGVTANPGAGGLESILCELGYEWAEGDYEAGDIITFHSLTVHKALPNQTPGRVRLSCDLRFQPRSEPIEGASLMPHGPYEWEELYEGWSRQDLQYYWRDVAFKMTEFDESIRWQKDKIC